MAFTVACAQFAPEKAEVKQNLDKIAEIVAQAATENVDLLVLPEASTTGYFLEGGVLESSLSDDELAQELASRIAGKLTRSIDVVLGFYERAEGTLFNAAAYVEITPEATKVKGVYHKFFLPTYGVFDEERFVTRGRDLCVLDTRFGKLAILICEDVWHGILPTLCAIRGAQMLLVPAASPARGFEGDDIRNHDRYQRLFRAISEEHGMFCVNAQLCGFEGGKGFIGGSMITDPMGRTLAEAPLAEESLVVASVDLDLVTIARNQSPLIADLQTAWSDIRNLVESS